MSETELVARVEKLERDNRRLKRLGASALVLVTAMGLVAATRSVPDVIKAHAFEVVDSAGNVGMRLEASSEGAHIFIAPLAAPGEGRTAAVSIGANGDHSWVSLGRAAWFKIPTKKQPVVGIENDVDLSDSSSKGPQIALSDLSNSSSKGPQITLSDRQGYVTVLGSTDLLTPGTGETHTTSAASIVMFGTGKKHPLIWQAP